MELTQQAELVETLRGVAITVKASKDAQRQTTLVHELQRASVSLPPVFRLPLNPALQCCDIDIQVEGGSSMSSASTLTSPVHAPQPCHHTTHTHTHTNAELLFLQL